MSVLFKIGNTDFTSCIVAPTYKVNQVPDYDEWIDANRRKHRNIVRHTIKGTFTMKFASGQQYQTFLNALNTARSNNSDGDEAFDAELFVMNLNRSFTKTVYLSWDPNDFLPFVNRASYDGFEVTIEER